MARKPGDDLFADSVMSFGEHIEELRTALFRALIGLVIGVCVGLAVADDVVRLIESPLREALKSYHALRAVDKYAGQLEPEQLTLIERSGIAPQPMQIELSQLIDQINAVQPGLVEEGKVHVAEFDDTQMQRVDVQRAATALVAGANKSSAHAHILWNALTSAQQKQVQALAKLPRADAVSDADRRQMQEVLNALVEHPTLADNAQFDEVESLFRGEAIRTALSTFQDKATQQKTPTIRHRLNRWIVTGVLAPHVPRPRPQVMEIPVWTTVDAQIITLNAQEAFLVWFKAAMLTGFLIASPWIFWQIWMFVAAGLYPHEKGYVYTFLPFSMGLFAAGAALAFFAVFPLVLDFLFLYNRQLDIVPNLRLSEWMSLALIMPIGFGISFQLPLVMLLLERIGIFSVDSYTSSWRVAILVICVLSMFLTPADPGSMILMALPLIVLYFGGVGLCKWMPRRESPFGEGIDPA
jgi:sec-independent protein translocase protein TatC